MRRAVARRRSASVTVKSRRRRTDRAIPLASGSFPISSIMISLSVMSRRYREGAYVPTPSGPVGCRPHTLDVWQHTVTAAGQDSEIRFACRFASLPLPAHLADRQDTLLDHIDPGWTTRPQPVR